MPDIKYEIIKKIGIVSSFKGGTCEFNIVKWNNGQNKYDLRKWNNNYPNKGITFAISELGNLYNILKHIEMNEPNITTPKYTYKNGDAKAEIYDVLGIVSSNSEKSMVTQITYTSWTGKPKYDFRPWNHDYSACGKGISLDKNEINVSRLLIEKELLNINKEEDYDTSAIDDLLI